MAKTPRKKSPGQTDVPGNLPDVKTYKWTVYDKKKGEPPAPREVVAYQHLLTLAQETLLAKCLRHLAIDDMSQILKLGFNDLLSMLTDQGALNEMLNAVLVFGEGAKPGDAMKITHPVLLEVVQDFFIYNSGLIKSLKPFVAGNFMTRLVNQATDSPLKKPSSSARQLD